MADEDGEQEIKRALDAVQVVQSMIDVSSDRLNGLRTQCATSAELTQHEIRTLEGKLIKLFSRQLVNKAKLCEEEIPPEFRNIPSLTQWLQVVGLSQESIKMVCQRIRCLQSLQEKSDRELKGLLGNAREEEVRRLTRAIHNLKKYTEVLVRGGSAGDTEGMALYWDSWDRHHLMRGSPRARARHTRASVPSEDGLLLPNGAQPPPPAPPPGPLPLSRSASSIAMPPPPSPHTNTHNSKGKVGVKFPTTPPARRKHQTCLPPPGGALLGGEAPSPLTKSKSHESQLGVKVDGPPDGAPQDTQPNHMGDSSCSISMASGRSRLGAESGVPSSPLPPCSPVRSPPYRAPPPPNPTAVITEPPDTFKPGNLTVPRSPRTPTVSRGMGHYIEHRFTKTFKMIATCDYCEKQMFLGAGLRCKECKYKCHRDCESKVPPSCGLPEELVEEFIRKMQFNNAGFPASSSPVTGRSPQHGPTSMLGSIQVPGRKRSHPYQPNMTIFPGGPDSSSNTSSCNSSTPSSPALMGAGRAGGGGGGAGAAPPQTPRTPRTPHACVPPAPPPANKLGQQFHFPEVKRVWVGGENSVGSSSVVSVLTGSTGGGGGGGAGDSEKTISLSGSASEDSERTPGGRTDSVDGDALHRNESAKWPRQNSLSMKEWDIPIDELNIKEAVGTGRFGTVYRGSWHGDVAIKLLDMHKVDNEAVLESFKLEVATFRKTRHENLVLFMGACMKPPRLAIVTSLCKGMTLYTHIHLRKDKFNMNRTTIVAQQISQGMGYLHARGIVHKDLKSKNIFLENGKVVITDFGLFSVTKLCFGNSAGDSLGIPAGWLCYLAPELVRGLRPRQARHADDLPFSKASDVYAFGTVWYELLCGEWPFKGQPPEAVIWQVGKGVKQTLANLQASRDVKDILMLCWSYRVSERPDFGRLLSTLEKLPRKRLARSPSHPVHLSRSAESVF